MEIANNPKELLVQLGELGLEVRRANSGHHKVYEPKTGVWLFNVSNSPSDVNWFWNIKRHLRRLGLLDIPATKRKEKDSAIDLVALKKAQITAAAHGEHVPILDDLEDSTEFFRRIKNLAQEEVIEDMVGQHDTRTRLKKFMDSAYGEELNAKAQKSSPSTPKGKGKNSEFVRIAMYEVAPNRGIRSWKSEGSGQQTLYNLLGDEENVGISLWVMNLLEATMDTIEGMQWSEHISKPEPVLEEVAEATLDAVNEETEEIADVLPTKYVHLHRDSISERYANILLGLLENYTIKDKEDAGLTALLDRLDKLAGLV